MVADVTIGSFDWSENGILRELKGLQENGAFADLSFTCSDGLVLDAHQTVIQRHSALLKEFSRSTQGKDHSDSRLGQVSVVLPDVTSDAMETLLRLLYVGEATVDGEGAATELLDVCRMLGIALPSEITNMLRETPKEKSETPSAPMIRLKSAAELMSPSKVGPSTSSEKSRLECPDCRRSFPLQFALNKHMEKGCESVEVTVEVNPFPGTPVNLQERSNSQPWSVTMNADDDEPMILGECPGQLPAPPAPTPVSAAKAILQIATRNVIPNVQLPPSNGHGQLPKIHGVTCWPQAAEEAPAPVGLNFESPPFPQTAVKNKSPKKQKTSSTSSREYGSYGSAEGPAGDECPICHKFYPNQKKREHFASTHFQPELRKFVTTADGVTTCTLCGKTGKNVGGIARHCGLRHNKLEEVVGTEHYVYIKHLGNNHKSRCESPTVVQMESLMRVQHSDRPIVLEENMIGADNLSQKTADSFENAGHP